MKKVQVVWTREAIDDLEIIFDFLAANSAAAAKKICENILNRTRQVETFPESGAQQHGLEKSNYAYRYLVEGNYKIIYSYHENSKVAHIHTIFDTRLNPDKLRV